MIQKSLFLLWAVTLLLLACVPTSVENTPTEGLPEDAVITTIEVSPNFADDGILLLGTEIHGLFRSQDGGASWENVLTLPNSSVRQGALPFSVIDIAFSPAFSEDGEIYIGAEVGLYRSSDGGDTWERIQDTPFGYAFRIAISPDYSSDETLFVTASDNELLWRTQDRGLSWSNLGGLRDVHFLPNGSILARTILEAARSTNMGDNWSHRFFESESAGMYALTLSPNFLEDGIAFWGDATGRNNMQRLEFYENEYIEDLGFRTAVLNCHNRGYGAGCIVGPALSSDFAEDGTVFAASFTGPRQGALMKSVDKGVTWEQLPFPTADVIVDIAVSPAFSEDGTVLAATHSGVFISKDGGESWQIE